MGFCPKFPSVAWGHVLSFTLTNIVLLNILITFLFHNRPFHTFPYRLFLLILTVTIDRRKQGSEKLLSFQENANFPIQVSPFGTLTAYEMDSEQLLFTLFLTDNTVVL